MDGDLATALAAERAIVHRAVTSARDIDAGWVVRHPPLPDVWHLNRLHLTGGAGAGCWLEALAERELAGLPHRRVTVDDAAAAEACGRPSRIGAGGASARRRADAGAVRARR